MTGRSGFRNDGIGRVVRACSLSAWLVSCMALAGNARGQEVDLVAALQASVEALKGSTKKAEQAEEKPKARTRRPRAKA